MLQPNLFKVSSRELILSEENKIAWGRNQELKAQQRTKGRKTPATGCPVRCSSCKVNGGCSSGRRETFLARCPSALRSLQWRGSDLFVLFESSTFHQMSLKLQVTGITAERMPLAFPTSYWSTLSPCSYCRSTKALVFTLPYHFVLNRARDSVSAALKLYMHKGDFVRFVQFALDHCIHSQNKIQ